MSGFTKEVIEAYAKYPQCDHTLTEFYLFNFNYWTGSWTGSGVQESNQVKQIFMTFLENNYGRIRTTIDDGDLAKMVGFRTEEEALTFLLMASHIQMPTRVLPTDAYYEHIRYANFWWTNNDFIKRMNR